MKFKDFLISLTFLLGCCVLTSALSDYEAEGGDLPFAQASGSEQLTPPNEDIFESAALQQEIAESAKKIADLDLEMESETEVSVKSVRNISNNQISPDYGSLEYQNTNSHQRPDESTEAVTTNEEALYLDTEEVTDVITKAKSRMGRLLPTTTSIPSYLRRTKPVSDDLNQSQENLNLSMSDYAEDDERVGGGQQTLRSKPAATQSPAIYEDHIGHQKRIHDKGDDIVPLAMKYYDVDDEDDGDSHRHHRQRYQDDDDDYNVEAEGGVGGVNNKLSHNAPVPMPRQQLLEHNHHGHRQHQQQQPHQPQQQNSSEEYYDEEQLTASKEDESSTLRSRSSSSTTTPSSASATQVPDNNVVRALFAGFPFTFNPTTTAPVPAATTTTSTTSIDSLVTPITQYDPLFVVTTTAPGAHHAIMQTFNAGAAAAAPALPGDKKGKQIPIIGTTTTTSSTSPSSSSSATTLATGGSHSRRRLLPHEQLRNYIEDAYIRMPLAVIVDPSTDSLEKTKSLWNDALRTNLNIKIVLVTLNESDIPAAFNFNNTRQFLTGLNSIKEQEGGDAFRGISHAAELVPYDSAVFISTATLANHTDQVHDAAITLLKKRIRLYLIWFGERALSENETQESVGGILGEVAIRSGGEVLHIVGSENSQELEGSTLTIVADAFRGSQEVDVPVDTTLSSLHVKIDKLMRRAVLETPNGEINLKKLVKFKSRLMMSPADDKRLDAYVPLTKLRKATVYKLKMIPEDLEAEYSVFIRGERKADTFLDDMIKHFETYFYEGQTSYPARFRNSRLQSITSALAIATVPTHSQLRFPTEGKEMARKQPKDEVETFSTHVIHKNPENGELMPSQNDTTTSTATAAADTMLNQRSINVLQRTNIKIEMGIHSQVLIAPGMIGQLYFDVTNTGCNNIYYTIQVVDERRYLMKLAPQSLFLQAGQMATVTVTVLVPQSTQTGTIDHITFSATGGGSTTSLSINLKVITSQDAQDNSSPSVSWDFGSRCDSIAADSASCSERFWSLFITAQDWQTGMLRLQSTPNAGLIYSGAYTVGATEPLKASYIATCCEPKVSIVAYDVAGNQRSYNIDVRDLVLNEASIAAIVLGAILLILIIILIIAGIVWCCRRRKVVLDLPTYRSHSTRSME